VPTAHVEWWDNESGYGCIQADDGERYSVTYRDVIGTSVLYAGQQVEFTSDEDRMFGFAVARKVKPVA
jgi:cold shock CspA family protein